MATTLETLKELRKRVDQIENKLIEVRQSIDQILTEHGDKPDDDWRSKVQWADTEALREWFDEWLKQLGINNVIIHEIFIVTLGVMSSIIYSLFSILVHAL